MINKTPIRLFFVISVLLFMRNAKAQNSVIDSLQTVVNSNVHDTIKINALIAWDNLIYNSDAQKDKEINLRVVEISSLNLNAQLHDKEIYFYKKSLGWAYNNLGLQFKNSGQYEIALDYYNKSLGVKFEINDEKGIAHCYLNIGVIFHTQGEFNNALIYYFKCLKIREQLKDLAGIAGAYNNIGAVYHYQDDFTTAEKYYNKCLEIAKEINSAPKMSSALNNLGNVLFEKGDSAVKSYNKELATILYNNSLEYYNESLAIENEAKSLSGISKCYNNLGTVFFKKDMLDTALFYFTKSAELKLQLGELQGYSSAMSNIGKVFATKKDFRKAIEYGLIAKTNAEKVNAIIEENSAYDLLYEVYKGVGDYKNALLMHEKFLSSRDSISSKENITKTTQQQFQYEYAKKNAEDSVKQAEEIKLKNVELKVKDVESKNQQLEIKAQQTNQYYLIIGLGVLGLFGLFIFNRLKITQRQKKIILTQQQETEKQKQKIESQHYQLEETHKEISDSIKYAERLQLAILPPTESMNLNLGDGFVLFQPKDVVSGDFYWMQRVGETVLFAAADCTGHGVPGALVSVVCSNAMNRSVKEFGFKEPKDILNKTRELVIETFSRSSQEVKDGMDIALCGIKEDNSGKKHLSFSGANNPLWIIRKTSKTDLNINENKVFSKNEYSVIEYKGDKQPIGLFDNMKGFNQQEVELEKGDRVYVFTDGFADQFGGEKGKKLMYKPLKEMLIDLHDTPMNEQKNKLSDFFETWKGNNEQVDDVCIIGVKI